MKSINLSEDKYSALIFSENKGLPGPFLTCLSPVIDTIKIQSCFFLSCKKLFFFLIVVRLKY